ncbi:hypothetical protein GGR38_002382 [Novosphingobium sediminicola]|uniref:Uncharacterized protein n=1 Tax=Novosphingobium sediminicola TaxID=563162 RepID=A0A7W6CF71_9SPHN|nr:hypothetical protein [Novosphingobium sediminicola]
MTVLLAMADAAQIGRGAGNVHASLRDIAVGWFYGVFALH